MQKSYKTIIIGSLIAVIFGVVSSILFPLYALLPGVLIVPFLVILTLRAGAFCGGLAVVLLLVAAFTREGIMGAVCILLTVPGCFAAITLLLKRQANIYHVTFYGAALMMTGMIVFWAVYTLFTGSDPATDLVAGLQWGLTSMLAADEMTRPSVQILERFFLQGGGDLIKIQMLPQMVTLSCLSALLGSTLPVVNMRRHALSEQVSKLGLLHVWRVPRRVSMVLMSAYVFSYILHFSGIHGMLVVSLSVWRAIEVVYGAIALSFLSELMRNAAIDRSARNLLLTLSFLAILAMHAISLQIPFSMSFVVIGIIGEMRRIHKNGSGDQHGPFGPPDPLPIDSEKNDSA